MSRAEDRARDRAGGEGTDHRAHHRGCAGTAARIDLGPASTRTGSILYGVDVTTGEVLFRKALPSPVSIDAYWPHWVDPSYEYNAFVRGPDGFVWTYLKDVLVRIDPKDASVHVVGKIDPVGWPTFVGNDLYLSGPEQLRRIRTRPGENLRPLVGASCSD